MRWKLNDSNAKERTIKQLDNCGNVIASLAIRPDKNGFFELDHFPTDICLTAVAKPAPR